MIKIPPCDLPMVFWFTIGKNGTNSTIGRFSGFTIGRTPNVAMVVDTKYGAKYSKRWLENTPLTSNDQKETIICTMDHVREDIN